MVDLIVDKKSEGLRLDRFLRKHFSSAPLSLIYKSLRNGVYHINGKKEKPNYRLKNGDNVTLFLSPGEYENLTKKEKTVSIKKTFEVLYEDGDILIVNKPPMLASQPGTGVEKYNLIDQVKAYLKDASTKPALAHRLDRGTSGIVIIGKNRQAILSLFNLFKERKVEKYYLALAVGHIRNKQGMLRSSLKKTTQGFQHRMLIVPKNEEGSVTAETSYKVLEESPLYSLLELHLHTGKMHQIRAQLAHQENPILGDRIYGNSSANRYPTILRRQFLHAVRIRFIHPISKKIIDITAPLPEDLTHILDKINMKFSLESYGKVK